MKYFITALVILALAAITIGCAQRMRPRNAGDTSDRDPSDLETPDPTGSGTGAYRVDALHLGGGRFLILGGEPFEAYDLIDMHFTDDTKIPEGEGQHVRFTTNGIVRESYPMQADGEALEIVEERISDLAIPLSTAVTVHELGSDLLLVDVRETDEYAGGHVPDAVNVPLSELSSAITEAADTDQMLAVYCRSGARSRRAQKQLQKMGYLVIDAGGIMGYDGEITTD